MDKILEQKIDDYIKDFFDLYHPEDAFELTRRIDNEFDIGFVAAYKKVSAYLSKNWRRK